MKKTQIESIEELLSLMTIYRDEWKFRSQEFVSYFWRFLYLSLIITFLPNFLDAINVTASIVYVLPAWLFSTFGIMFSVFGLYFGLAENERITNIDNAYRSIEQLLPKEFRVQKIDKWYYRPRLNICLCIISYSVTIVLAIINAIFLITAT